MSTARLEAQIRSEQVRTVYLHSPTTTIGSLVAGTALVAVMFAFCRRAFGERTAALAVVVLATTPLVVGFARLVIFDMPLALFTAVAILAGYLAEEPPETAEPAPPCQPFYRPCEHNS